ncbi:MAG: amidase [Chloroflexota bacterium]|nr:amidase [Chloroflexota bacterium]
MGFQDGDFRSISALRELLDTRAISASELVQDTLDLVRKTNAELNSFVLVTEKLAIEQANAADDRLMQNSPRGPLDGIPLAIKDLYDTAGIATAGGTLAFKNRVPDKNAAVVESLTAAGMVTIGKTNTHELALGGTTNNPHYGPTRNPWDLDRVPGGSSGGSGAALAAGQVPAALGTDTGGSVRIPASFCGVTGLKPTFGLVKTDGVIPLSRTLDHAGPMARSALDCALLLDGMTTSASGTLYSENIHQTIAGVRLAVIPALTEDCEPHVGKSFEYSLSILQKMGVDITEVDPMKGADNWRTALYPIIVSEGATYIEAILRNSPELVGEAVRTRMLKGLDASLHEYVRALEWRAQVERRFDLALIDNRLDGYIVPTSPQVAELIDTDPHTGIEPAIKFRNTSVFNNTRQPSISLPNGFDDNGLPTGLMITTAKGTDDLTLRIGHNFQQDTDFHLQRPSA